MFLQNSLTGAESQAALRIRPQWAARTSKSFGRNLQHANSRATFRADDNSSATLAEQMQTIRNQLQTDLQQLVGVSQDLGDRRVEVGAYFDFKSLPLRLSQFNGSAGKRIEIQRALGRGRLASKADQTGYQGPCTAHVLTDLAGKGTLLCAERSIQ